MQIPLTSSMDLTGWLRAILQWIDGLGLAGGAAYIGIYTLATVAFLPGSILTLGAGVLFGAVLGSLYAWLGAVLGSTAAFLVGRYLARNWVSRQIAGNSKFAAIDAAVAREGLKIVLLTRLSPVFPFNLLNYGFGITGVTLRDYLLGAIGMLPATVMYVYIGSLASSLARLGSANPSPNPALQWAIRVVGLLATVAVTLYVTHLARKALSEQISE